MKFFPLFILLGTTCFAQPESKYDRHALFAPFFYPVPSNDYRAATGDPGPKYWQNRSGYQINAFFDDVRNQIKATAIITYTNNSPQALDYLWLQLDQNLYNKSSRGFAKLPANVSSRYGDINSDFNGGFIIDTVKIITPIYRASSLTRIITDTRMQLILPQALAPGGTIKFLIEYSFPIPPNGSDRMGILENKAGDIYCIGQWYPRMCVFDDLQGWNTLPYLGGGEFYLDYGDFDVTINAPAGHVVVSSGELQNPAEVLTPAQLGRYMAAKQSDKTITIKKEEETGKSGGGGRRIWHFKLANSRDFAWASSRSFIWDAARMQLPSGRKALAMSVYPPEAAGEMAWGRATEVVKGVLENYSKRWMEYPYPSAVNVAGSINGMEYPGIIFCAAKDKDERLFDVINHEFGHTLFPMIVGSNERKYGWMDEGFTTLIENINAIDFNNGEFKNADAFANPWENFGEGTEALMNIPDVIRESNIGTALYYKPGYALYLLRNFIIGEQRFDYALRTYLKKWAYRHPSPFDFFRTIENATGEDLGWFWRELFFENYSLDQRVNAPVYVNGDPAKGALVEINNLEQMAMPIYLGYVTASGRAAVIKVPVEVWQNHDSWMIRLPSTERIVSLVLDPERVFPDVNYENNRWNE